MSCKLIALGPFSYAQSRWNLFDGAIVTISVIDTALELAMWRESAGTNIFRAIRIVRITPTAFSAIILPKLLTYLTEFSNMI